MTDSLLKRHSRINRVARVSSTVLAAAVALTLAKASTAQPAAVIANKGQAMPKGARRTVEGSRADRKAQAKAAAAALMDLGMDDGRERLVVAHLQPRWLRAAVEALMDKGAVIDDEWVERLRAGGPDAARTAVEVYG